MTKIALFNGLSVLIAAAFSSVYAAPIAKRDSTPKFLFAHHMIGNTFPYTVQDWADDISLASASGIDAFALNIGTDSWQPSQVKNAYTAAQQSNATFKMFISFDMTVLPCASPDDAAALRNYITEYANHPAQFKYQGKSFASTFSGEKCAFGQGSPAQGWASQFKDQLTGANDVFFVPNFFVDPSTFGTFADAMDGQFNWNSAWPIAVTTNTLNTLIQKAGAVVNKLIGGLGTPLTTPVAQVVKNITGSLDSDHQYINALNSIGNKLYMASVSPWFFTHYSPQTFDKNFVYLTDQLYPSRWQSVIAARDDIPMVELITWNDYGESHYVGPVKGSQPNSQAWVDGMDHTGWLDLTHYFALAYKNGVYPTVTNDRVYLWARPHPKDANAPDPVGKPDNFDMLEDALFAVVLASAPSSLTIATSPTNTKTVNVPAGLSQLSLPMSAGDTMSATLTRGGQTVVSVKPQNFTFNGGPQTYNFNAFVAMGKSGAPAQ